MTVAACWLALLFAAPLAAQTPRLHFMHNGVSPPGAIGTWQLQRGGPLPGYFQPVELFGPTGLEIAVTDAGTFRPLQPAPVKVGLLVAPVYRFRVANIPLHPGAEVFPSVELIDRTYPPAGERWKFPIPIELTEEDLKLALSGRFVTRVIYIEDPLSALPVNENPREQRWFDAGTGADPLLTADTLGRPVAILRMGGRIPRHDLGEDDLIKGNPPLLYFHPHHPEPQLHLPPEQQDNPPQPPVQPQPQQPRSAGRPQPDPYYGYPTR